MLLFGTVNGPGGGNGGGEGSTQAVRTDPELLQCASRPVPLLSKTPSLQGAIPLDPISTNNLLGSSLL